MQAYIQRVAQSVQYAKLAYQLSQRDVLIQIVKQRHVQTGYLSEWMILLTKQLQLGADAAAIQLLAR